MFIPLHSTEAADLTAPAIAIIEIDGTVSDEQLEQFYAGDGPVGPVLVVNGVLSGGFNKDAQDAMSGNAELAADFYTIQPFMNGREEGLKVTGGGPIMAILGLILALILGAYGYFRKKREEKLIAEAEAFYAEVENAEFQQDAQATPDPDSETDPSDGPR